MRIIKSVHEMQREAERFRLAGKKIGFVPTMGYLHEGHLKLIQEAKRSSDVVILSIFVNPTQFSPTEDLSRYPRDFERDKDLATGSEVDILFNPEASEIYSPDFETYVEAQEASQVLEGAFRPTHFRGVTTVVAKLFNICKPHVAVFGQKDAQQVFIVKKMVRDLNSDVSIVVVPIVREPDGLAMSSRNVYLSKEERKNATVLHESLVSAEKAIQNGARDARPLQTEMKEMIRAKGSPSIDYVAFVNPETFRETEVVSKPKVLIALAVRFGNTRLIDNAVIPVD
jgi:pantoate--beta-alanine ligase